MNNITKKITSSCFALLLVAGVAHAADVKNTSKGTPCNGFEVKIHNNTPDDLLVSKLQLTGAEIQPNGLETIPAHSEQVFTVNNSADNGKMIGTLEFNSVSLPSKNAYMKFELKNKNLVCHHDAQDAGGDYHVDHSRVPGQVKYTIG